MRRIFLIGILALAGGVAQADTLIGVYGGAGITQAKVDNFLSTGLDIHNTSWKLFAGVHPSPAPIGVEAEYLDFGSQTNSFAHAESRAFAVDALGYLPLPIPILDIYGKIGLSRWQLSGSILDRRIFGLDDHGTQLTWGVGGQAHFGALAARLEYEHFNINGTDGANVYTLGVLFTFL
jgi:opacity protein-like surface antigen